MIITPCSQPDSLRHRKPDRIDNPFPRRRLPSRSQHRGWRPARRQLRKLRSTSIRKENFMPDIKTDDGCTIHAEIEGPQSAPVLMLSNSLGTNLHMWDDQVAPFTKHFRLLRYDRRGHGQSGVPKGPYTMERLGRDVLAVLDGLGIAKINWCG